MVLCKAYGLGAMGLGYSKELEAVADGPAREVLFKQLVAQQYSNGEAMHMAATLEIDAVIDPADTRSWLVRGLDSATTRAVSAGRFVDTW